MNGEKFIGLDVHQATISVAVLDSSGKLLMESILETIAAIILQFFAALRGRLLVTFEEGTCAAWLYDLLKPHVAELVVYRPSRVVLKAIMPSRVGLWVGPQAFGFGYTDRPGVHELLGRAYIPVATALAFATVLATTQALRWLIRKRTPWAAY